MGSSHRRVRPGHGGKEVTLTVAPAAILANSEQLRRLPVAVFPPLPPPQDPVRTVLLNSDPFPSSWPGP